MTSRDSIRQLLIRMSRLGISKDDLVENFVRGSGKGGQKINKTSSTVQLRHEPSGIDIRCQRERSLTQNRYWARVELCEKLETRKRGEHLARQAATAKKRRQNRKRSAGEKAKMIQEKRHRSDVKRLRSKPGGEE